VRSATRFRSSSAHPAIRVRNIRPIAEPVLKRLPAHVHQMQRDSGLVPCFRLAQCFFGVTKELIELRNRRCYQRAQSRSAGHAPPGSPADAVRKTCCDSDEEC
jgi:hypothetical protein